MRSQKKVTSEDLGTGANPPEIFSFHDYREYLAAWIKSQKAQAPQFSVRSLSMEIGVAASYFPMILAGLRHLSDRASEKLLPKLKLGATESAYFKLLVVLGTTDSQSVRLEALEQMKRLKLSEKKSVDDLESYQYLSRWYFVAIRELASLKEFKADPKWIRNRLGNKISMTEAKQALEFLISRDFIEKTAEGLTRTADKTLVCIGGAYRIGLTEFHRQVLDLAKDSITTVPSEARQIQGHTMALSPEKFDEARSIMTEALEKIASLNEPHAKNANVYHLELALFPLSRNEKKDKSDE